MQYVVTDTLNINSYSSLLFITDIVTALVCNNHSHNHNRNGTESACFCIQRFSAVLLHSGFFVL